MAVKQKTVELEKDTPKFRNFDWEKAKTFYYVAKCGSFASAAQFLNISASALSRQIRDLEHQLGCPLFIRHSGGVKLTRKGAELLAIIETTFIELKGFTFNPHAHTSNGKKRTIRIATTHAIAAYILDDLIFAYHDQNPNIVFELITDDHLIDIVLNDVDIAIRPYDPSVRGVQQEELFTLEKKLYASPEYLEKYGEPQTVKELKNHRIIAPAHPEDFPYADVNWILRLGLPAGQLHEPIFTSTAVECAIKAAKNGLGIIGSYEQMENIKNSQLKNILPDVTDKKVTCYFVFSDYLKKNTELIELKEYLHRELSPQEISKK